MTVRNVFLSLILSLVLTFVVTVLYVFYPVISLIAGSFFQSISSSEPHTDSIAVVAGGSGSLWISVVIALASFLIIFTLLQRRSRRR
jgi:hypothetical protein